jgi:antitoxin MazE
MRLDLIPIGNSRGVRLSQSLIKQCGFKDTVEVELLNHCLILKAPEQLRAGWEELFKTELPDPDRDYIEIQALQNAWDDEEWEW